MDSLERVRTSFAKQGLMTTLGAKLGAISPGAVEIILIPSPAISQQHGFVHAGAVSSIADSAAGYASLSLVPSGTSILTAEFKINLVAPRGRQSASSRAGPRDQAGPHPDAGAKPMCSRRARARKS